MVTRSKNSLAAAFSLLGTLSVGAHGFQEASPQVLAEPINGANAATPALEEVVVTAQKRAQSTQEIGMTVESLSGDALRDKGFSKAEDLAKVIPNMSMVNVTGGGLPIVLVRGVGLQNFRVNDSPTTAFYVDEVYQSNVAAADFSMFDLERIELLKGPQGGLYGRNTISGAVQVISRQANVDEEANGYVKAGYGTYGHTELEAAFGAPLSDTVAMRVAVRSEQSGDTDYQSTTSDFEHGEVDRWGGRAMLHVQPSDTIDVQLKIHGGEDNSETPLLQAVPTHTPGVLVGNVGLGAATSTLCDDLTNGLGSTDNCVYVNGLSEAEADYGVNGRYDSAGDFPNFIENSWNGASVKAAFEFDELTFTAISAVDNLDYRRAVDLDGLPIEWSHLDYNTSVSGYSQEFRLARDAESFNWVVGVNYAADELEEASSALGSEGLFPVGFSANGLVQNYTQETKALAVYGHAEWGFADDFNLVGELRHTDASKTFEVSQTLDHVSVGPVPFPGIDGLEFENDYQNLSGKLALEYFVSEDLLTYASVSKGFKTGGFYGGVVFSPDELQPYDSETILAYETGFKSDLLERRMRLNGAAFYYDRSDVQQSATTTGENPVTRLTNVGDVDVVGAELDLEYLLTQSWSVKLALGYTDSELMESDLVSATIPGLPAASIAGTNTPNYSKVTSILSTNYEQSLSDSLTWMVNLDYSYRSERDLNLITQSAEEALLREPAVGLASLRFALREEVQGWTAGLAIDNATDEEYRTAVRDNGLRGMYQIYGAPRTARMTFTYDF
ncbi:TonB-dependent receptor [Microbulbifer agarilyticus]